MSNDSAFASTIRWDSGLAYDFFASLHVFYHPDRFGLRPAWAAGVRSRLPEVERHFLDEAHDVVQFPLRWLFALPAPKTPTTALSALQQIAPDQRLPSLGLPLDLPEAGQHTLLNVAARGAWSEADREKLRTFFQPRNLPPRVQKLSVLLDWWARPAEFGERYLAALQAYRDVFFAEEQRRIAPVLERSLAEAQTLAQQVSLPSLVETLSQGVSFPWLTQTTCLILVPSFWITPLVVFGDISPGCTLLVFGARPADVERVPGEGVPEALLAALKALADPTRLLALRMLAGKPLTLAEMARHLRLRPPTMIHHLTALRLAGLVHVAVEANGDKRYTVRPEAVQAAFQQLSEFLASPSG